MHYKQYEVPCFYEMNRNGNIELTPENFQKLIAPTVAGAFDENRVAPDEYARLIRAGFVPVRGDVRAAFVSR